MRRLLALLLPFVAPLGAAAQPAPAPAFNPSPLFIPAPAYRPAPAFNPAADYVTPGQDEPGYQSWYKAASWRPVYVRAFHNYLVSNGVGGVAPTWQLLRTASQWQRCGADPFEVPPTADWSNIVATLRFIRAFIVPVIGPVEPVSVYRNPMLNLCAGGAQASTHREMGAVDIVPLRPITREALMLELCAIHAAHPDSNNGLGFYKGLRFHIDARKYREWGTQGARGGYGCNAVLAESAVAPRGAPARAAAAPLIPMPSAPAFATPPVTTQAPATSAPVAAAQPDPAPTPPVSAPAPPPVSTDRLAPLAQ